MQYRDKLNIKDLKGLVIGESKRMVQDEDVEEGRARMEQEELVEDCAPLENFQ